VYLVDTNVLSELPRPRPAPAVLRWLQQQSAIVVSVVSVEELAFGVARAPLGRRPKLARWLESLLEAAETVDVSLTIAKAAGELRAARESAGRRVAQADMLIAATAVVRGLTLATRNVRDFEACGVALINPFET